MGMPRVTGRPRIRASHVSLEHTAVENARKVAAEHCEEIEPHAPCAGGREDAQRDVTHLVAAHARSRVEGICMKGHGRCEGPWAV